MRARLGRRPQLADALVWAAVVAAGLVVTAVAVHTGARVGTPGAPFSGHYRPPRVVPASAAAPLVAGAVLVAVRRGVAERLPWRALLALSWLVAAAWAVALAAVDGRPGLAGPVLDPSEYLADADAVTAGPAAFLGDFVAKAPSYAVATRTHPPGAALLVAGVAHVLGRSRPELVGVGVVAVGALAVPLVGVSVRSLCHEPAARRLLPVVALAPWALWTAVSLDAVATAVCAAFLACGVVAAEPGRGRRSAASWAAVAGLLLGVAALLGYALAWLGVSLVAVYFVRRRPLLNAVTGLGALVPLTLVSLAGFSWTAGLAEAQADFSERVGRDRSWLLWVVLDLVLLAVACGPTVVAAVRGLPRTPGWPFVLGAGLAVVFALASGLSRGEVERSWLPFYPWLLVPAVAPLMRPRAAGPGAPLATPVPVGLIAVGCATAVVLQAVLASTW